MVVFFCIAKFVYKKYYGQNLTGNLDSYHDLKIY